MDDAARKPLFSPATAAALLLGMLLATRLPQLPPLGWTLALLLAGGIGWLLGRGGWRIAGAFVLGMAMLMG